jgi:alkylhydroperoxidase/carboxymuconolactone decarboxylase family protein YurZ
MAEKNIPPLKPTAMLNYNLLGEDIGKVVANFWKIVWNSHEDILDVKTRYMLSLANAVGARRLRQATREFVKAYAAGVSAEQLGEVFKLLAWNEGIGTFSSEIGPSPLFGAYKLVRAGEKSGRKKEEIIKELVDKFGEKNPAVSTQFDINK